MGMKKFLLGLVGIVCALFAVPAHALPDGYTELSYVNSVSAIVPSNISIADNHTLVLETDMAFSSTSGNPLVGIFGGLYFGISNGAFSIGNIEINMTANTNRHQFVLSGIAGQSNTRVTLNVDNDTFTIQRNTINGIVGILGLPGQNPYNASATVYKTRIYDNNVLVGNFVPAKHGDDIGFYNTVNNTFVTATTGTLIAGPIACDGTVVNYTSATGTVTQNGTPTPDNPIEPTFYTQGNMVLRKVGDYADTYDASTGKITRRVGVLTLTGTEDIAKYDSNTYPTTYTVPAPNKLEGVAGLPISNSFAKVDVTGISNIPENKIGASATAGNDIVWINMSGKTSAEDFKSWLAEQYAAGTPVTVYYPFKTATTEDWTESSYCYLSIKIASTKYTETMFNPLNTALANAVATVNTVVTQTIAQAASIATLQSGKQTRPADNTECPAYKQCLLVEDESGTPHWYQITDPFRDFVTPIIANNVAPASTTNQPGFTQLEYIESTGTQRINTGIMGYDTKINITAQATGATIANVGDTSVPVVLIGYFGGYYGTYAGAYTGKWGVDNGRLLQNISATNKTNLEIVFTYTESTKNQATISSGLYSASINRASGSAQANGNLLLFGNENLPFIGRVYSLSIYNNNTGALLGNFIPARRNSDSVVGMYDTVTKTFFTNAGSGTFTAGPTVANTDVPANGTWTATWAANATTGVTAGTVSGEGLCNNVAGTANTAATSAQMSSANWSVDGASCWCRATGVDDGDDTTIVDGVWVFGGAYSAAADCTRLCGSNCAYYVRNDGPFRSAVFGM